MRITTIEFAGTIEAGQKLPRTFAKAHRKLDSDLIEVTIFFPDGEKTHHVQADCDEDIWSMAECLQCHLDGARGNRGDINVYYGELRHFAD